MRTLCEQELKAANENLDAVNRDRRSQIISPHFFQMCKMAFKAVVYEDTFTYYTLASQAASDDRTNPTLSYVLKFGVFDCLVARDINEYVRLYYAKVIANYEFPIIGIDSNVFSQNKNIKQFYFSFSVYDT